MNINENLRNLRENSGKMGYTTQLLIALAYKTVTKLMMGKSSSTLVKYANNLIVISINIKENCRSNGKFVKKKNKGKGVVNSYLIILLPTCSTFK